MPTSPFALSDKNGIAAPKTKGAAAPVGVAAPEAKGAAAPQLHSVATRDGAELSLRVYGPVDAPRLVVSHGNGLASDGYRCFWEPLADEFQVVVLDLRGHGLSRGSDDALHTWNQLVDDLEAVSRYLDAALGPRPTFGVFHSLSAVVSVGHLRRYGPRWCGLLLFDPPLPPPDGHPLHGVHVANMTELARGARVRQREFGSPDALATRFARAPMFRRWRPDARTAMARALLRRDLPNQWELACPPELEARIFESNTDTTLWSVVRNPGIPCQVVGGDPGIAGAQSPALMGLAAARKYGIDYVFVPDTTHFLQLERPDECGAIARAFCRANGGR